MMAFFLLVGIGYADTTLFYDGFEASSLTTVWTAAGTGGSYRDITAPLCTGAYKYECTNKKYITNKKAISTVGYSNIRFNFYMAADSLEAGEYCQAQYSTDGGTVWIVAAEIRDPKDTNTFTSFNIALPSEAENIANLKIRFRIYGSAINDYLKVDEVYVIGKMAEKPPFPIFDNIPFAIGVVVDDLGWKEHYWLSENSRNATNEDYQTIMDVGQAVGTRIMTAWVMCDMDRSNILAKAEYNKPLAPYNMSTSGIKWDNTSQVSPNDFALMNLVKDNNAYMEFGLHGATHRHPNAKNVLKTAEYALITQKLHTSTSWGWTDMNIRAKCFRDLIRQYFTVDEMAFPEAFVPPAHAYFYNNNNSQSTGALLSTYGVKFVNGGTSVATTLGQGGTDHGLVFIDRAYGANYYWENTDTQNATPWYGDWNDFYYPKYPTDAYGWVESHFPNWWGYDAHNRWVTYLQGINNAPDRMLPRNTESCSSQWFYHRNASISGSDGTYTLTINSSMPDAVYTWNLLGTLTIKTPLNGGHVSSASINNGAQVVGYYEDTYDYGYLIIANPSNSIGALAKGTYTLNATLGDTEMSSYVDMTLKTFNVYGFNASSTQSTVSLKMYGTQDVKVKTMFTPTVVSSDNPNLTVNDWTYTDGFITINVSGRNMNGETGTLTIN
jgi:hypothetical protein